MKFKGGLLIGIGIGFILFVLFTMIIALVVLPYSEEVAQEKRLEEYNEKKAQEKLERVQSCEDDGGTWISCPPCHNGVGATCETCVEYCQMK